MRLLPPATQLSPREQATVADGTFSPWTVILQCAPASMELISMPKLDDGADEAKPVATAAQREAEEHVTSATVATACGSVTRRQVLPPLSEAYAPPSPGPGTPWVNVEPTARQFRGSEQVIELVRPVPPDLAIEAKVRPSDCLAVAATASNGGEMLVSSDAGRTWVIAPRFATPGTSQLYCESGSWCIRASVGYSDNGPIPEITAISTGIGT